MMTGPTCPDFNPGLSSGGFRLRARTFVLEAGERRKDPDRGAGQAAWIRNHPTF